MTIISHGFPQGPTLLIDRVSIRAVKTKSNPALAVLYLFQEIIHSPSTYNTILYSDFQPFMEMLAPP